MTMNTKIELLCCCCFFFICKCPCCQLFNWFSLHSWRCLKNEWTSLYLYSMAMWRIEKKYRLACHSFLQNNQHYDESVMVAIDSSRIMGMSSREIDECCDVYVWTCIDHIDRSWLKHKPQWWSEIRELRWLETAIHSYRNNIIITSYVQNWTWLTHIIKIH